MTATRSLPVGTATQRNTAVMAAATLLSGLLNALILTLSARHGHTEEIAAFTVMTAALAFVAIATGGGASLLYLSGDDGQRHAVRCQWVFVILPSMMLGTLLIGSLYARWGYPWAALGGTAVVVIGNNLALLQYADLTRQLRFTVTAAIICGCKVPAVLLVVAGFPLSKALIASAVVQFAAAEISLRRTTWLRPRHLAALSAASGLAALRGNRRLFAYTVADLYNARGTSLALSLFVTPVVMGAFGAVLSVYQALCGVMQAGLQVPMAAKIRERLSLGERDERGRDGEILTIAGAFAMGIVLVACAPWITGSVLLLPDPATADWLRLLGIALPFAAVTRSVTANLIGVADYRSATRVVIFSSAALTLAALVALPAFGAAGATAAMLSAEVLTVTAISVTALRKHRLEAA